MISLVKMIPRGKFREFWISLPGFLPFEFDEPNADWYDVPYVLGSKFHLINASYDMSHIIWVTFRVYPPGHIFHPVFRNSMGLRSLEAMLEKSWEHFFSLKTFSNNLFKTEKTSSGHLINMLLMIHVIRSWSI